MSIDTFEIGNHVIWFRSNRDFRPEPYSVRSADFVPMYSIKLNRYYI